jgi:hypothetical protein
VRFAFEVEPVMTPVADGLRPRAAAPAQRYAGAFSTGEGLTITVDQLELSFQQQRASPLHHDDHGHEVPSGRHVGQ